MTIVTVETMVSGFMLQRIRIVAVLSQVYELYIVRSFEMSRENLIHRESWQCRLQHEISKHVVCE